MREFRGKIFGWFETGLEGMVWALQEDGKLGYDGLQVINAGDHLTILFDDKTKIFEGIIDPDHEAGWKEYPLNPGNGQPSALGVWIHWTQRGWVPNAWAALFLREEMGLPALRALLIKKDG